MRDTMKKKEWKSSGEIYILRHWIGAFIAFLAMKICVNIEQWTGWAIMFLVIVYNVWHVVLFLIDLAVGPKIMKMQYCRLKYCDELWRFFVPLPHERNERHYCHYWVTEYEVKKKWLAASIMAYQKGKHAITLRTICSGEELQKYARRKSMTITYYKYSKIVKKIEC